MFSDGRADRLARASRSASTRRATACVATTITLAYLWLPYMVLPIYAGLERVPDSLFEASATSGPAPCTTLRRVVLPMAFPAIVAGSIFTFSLSLGDYIAVHDRRRRRPADRQRRLRQRRRRPTTCRSRRPFATVPVVVMLVYLAAVRRTGALENL